jgi:hypothetical protein
MGDLRVKACALLGPEDSGTSTGTEGLWLVTVDSFVHRMIAR